MANAAAKKAAAAKSSTAGVYKPLLLGSNALYILLLFAWTRSWGVWFILGMLATWGLQGYAYVGILDQAANAHSTGKGNKNDLVGGVNLDILALTLVVQFGTALHSSQWYWLIMIVPIWGGWSLYKSYFGGSSKKTPGAAEEETTVSETVKQRREQRAEKRRKKWS
mmetsp:Transcript_27478/g.42270  ORF Transcript_27478/g.42270 Transcript_27478/m.42270 type:complete len:166 (+) Transcript_27478:275-772(+)